MLIQYRVIHFHYYSETERYKKIKWQDVRVGDLVHLSNNETVPADILLLRTSDLHGACYIDTCDLDGETNLKRREVNIFFKLFFLHINLLDNFFIRLFAVSPINRIFSPLVNS